MRIKEELNHKECTAIILPVRDAMEVLNGKWKLPIIAALNMGNKRFSDIARSIPKITDRMLAKELRDLELNHLVTRTVYNNYPVTIEYSLTEYAASLDKVIESLRDWGLQHRKKIISMM